MKDVARTHYYWHRLFANQNLPLEEKKYTHSKAILSRLYYKGYDDFQIFNECLRCVYEAFSTLLSSSEVPSSDYLGFGR